MRFWQVGIEMRPFFNKSSLWAYPAYALGGASFGHWLQGVDDRQSATLASERLFCWRSGRARRSGMPRGRRVRRWRRRRRSSEGVRDHREEKEHGGDGTGWVYEGGDCTYGNRGWTEVHTEMTMVFVCSILA